MIRLLATARDLWQGLVRNIVQDVPDALAVAEFGQSNQPFLPPALLDACVPDEPTPLYHSVRATCVRSAAWDRLGEYGDSDMHEWIAELLHTDDADIAADYDGLVYAAEWLAMHALPEPTDLGDDR